MERRIGARKGLILLISGTDNEKVVPSVIFIFTHDGAQNLDGESRPI
jgi:hypothetical protein